MTQGSPHDPRFRLRLVFAPGEMLGPGKADLLEGIARTGSIAAAGRDMGMSYKRAWQLVETMNAMFREPLVESTRGGAKGGGAVLTEAGQAVLTEFRSLEAVAEKAGAAHIDRLQAMLRDIPDQK
ncbi:molybdate transport system regulatory protein [Roseovarius litoreus]|jgi:molybdate transport system regulatory protein|uniref:Molybdate transport system regulatory protein n=1 Tax=Roseovarius litoreus TaxID=1155722 RepID=A0A1M6ZPD9_9RHOB|nr:winged helix-turn-helix domain-containing protein [Roseovarius litoreus]SHL32284.1 molybdate transport system regulatory protein [Roseovarius litoreus]